MIFNSYEPRCLAHWVELATHCDRLTERFFPTRKSIQPSSTHTAVGFAMPDVRQAARSPPPNAPVHQDSQAA